MKFALECANCILHQVKKVAEIEKLDSERFDLLKEVLNAIYNQDLKTKTSPEIYGIVWQTFLSHFDGRDLYKEIRKKYNQKFLTYVPELKKTIQNSKNPLKTALATAILGNMLDLAIQRNFSIDELLESIKTIENTPFGIDNSEQLLSDLSKSKTVLYLGDNCGEIVFDKLFIQTIKKQYPSIQIFYGVRGKPAVNDVILGDALQVHMQDFSTIVENGDGSLGTVIDRCSEEFKNLYNTVDMVIAKGQGNYESLSETPRKSLYYLLLTKCQLIANELHVDKMSIVCALDKTIKKAKTTTLAD
ncbi:MAG: hypothetical protein BKP49_11270 [Treponema sp. CETP13]|nr:MAG: hypothetical protein BKP49_11270 [Treponema sp. CETP13]